MARTVNEEVYIAKRTEILDAAQRLALTKGFGQMAIRDILEVLSISGGSFHHYFASRQALLDALIDRIQFDSGKPLLPIVNHPNLSAIQKLQGIFDAMDQIRIAQKASIVELLRVWYTDDNAIVRQKVDEAVFKHRAPLLTEIVRQGIQEGVFSSGYPQQQVKL
jgi:AcrR family transcriptional regulator